MLPRTNSKLLYRIYPVSLHLEQHIQSLPSKLENNILSQVVPDITWYSPGFSWHTIYKGNIFRQSTPNSSLHSKFNWNNFLLWMAFIHFFKKQNIFVLEMQSFNHSCWAGWLCEEMTENDTIITSPFAAYKLYHCCVFEFGVRELWL